MPNALKCSTTGVKTTKSLQTCYIPNKSRHVIRRNGVFFTPDAIADALAGGIRIALGDWVLDPACGNGVLLRAVRNASLTQEKLVNGAVHLVGCDRLNHTRDASLDGGLRIIKRDFFVFKPK